jgi:hypothetical protein
MIFDPLAFVRARPVHEKTRMYVDQHSRTDHIREYAESRDSAEKAQNHPQRAEGFGHDDQEDEPGR